MGNVGETILHWFDLNIGSFSLSPVPSPPSGLTVFQNGEDSVLVSWTPLAGEAAVTGYTISYHTQDGEQTLSFSHSASTAIITNLAIGVSYIIKFVVKSTTLPSVVRERSITIGKSINFISCFYTFSYVVLLYAQVHLLCQCKIWNGHHPLKLPSYSPGYLPSLLFITTLLAIISPAYHC